tara:strand:- start:1110 stop:2153 length:1044 start_codon:yes stop_codon:yes gene_type:complete
MKSKSLFKILKSKGFKNIELDNIIESKYVLKRSGGNFKQFLFSFYDRNLREWSLVPDLSVSSVVKFIRNKINVKTKWYYTGEAYRKQNENYNSPIINQTGFEIFASNNKFKDDKEIIQTSIEIFKQSNFKKAELNLSNIEIFYTLIDRLSLALRWKDRIKRHFCRKIYFNQLLKKLSNNSDIDPIVVKKDKKIAEKLRIQNPNTIYSGRTIKDILYRFDLKNYKEPRSESDKKNVKIIKDFLKISCPIERASETLNKFFKKNKLNIFVSKDYFPISQNKQKNIKIIFKTNINRSVEYYSGIVFNMTINAKGKKNILISGGRYDGLLKNLGSKKDMTAVGAALNMNLL